MKKNVNIYPVMANSLLGVSVAASFASCGQKANVPEKPLNIVYIMSDDHSYQTISAYDGRFNQTPNIDRIAQMGMKFTSAYVENSISGPSRACLLTGKFSHKNGFYDNSTSFDGSQQTFPKLLQAAGYQTAIVGKWHLVSDPTGFDYWDIVPGQGQYYNPQFITSEGTRTVEGYVTDITTDLALNWLDSNKDNGKPFCLLIHNKAPHRSWEPDIQDLGYYDDANLPLPETFYDDYSTRTVAELQRMSIAQSMSLTRDLKIKDTASTARPMNSRRSLEDQEAWDAYYDKVNEEYYSSNLTGNDLAEWKYKRYMSDYLGVINSVDRNVGRVLDYLEENGLMENTIIVYTSDQGFYMGEHGWFDKRFMYEESFRTPLLVYYPDGKKGDVAELVQNIDYAPTFLEAAGVEIPEDIQGESLLPILQDKKAKNLRNSLYYHYYEHPGEHSVMRHYGVKMDNYKLIHFYYDTDEWELFDLEKDPREVNNIYGQPGTEKITEKLEKEMLRLQEKYDDPIRFGVDSVNYQGYSGTFYWMNTAQPTGGQVPGNPQNQPGAQRPQ
jgi:arylsulfatase A-like enzyme